MIDNRRTVVNKRPADRQTIQTPCAHRTKKVLFSYSRDLAPTTNIYRLHRAVFLWVEFDMSAGRPSDYSIELATLICDRIASGDSLRCICKDDDMPVTSTVTRWLVDDSKREFWAQYAQARKAQAYLLADELIEIADDGTNDYVTKTSSDGSTYEALDSEHVQRSRLRLDTRKWYLSKVMPRDFGDKQTIDHLSTDGSMTPKSVDPKLVKALADKLID